MSRSLFFLIIVIVGLAFSGAMLLIPEIFAQNAGLSGSPENALLFRALGGTVLSVTLANFLVRNHPDSPTLAAVLWMNLAVHVLAIAVDLLGVAQGVIALPGILPGTVVHLAIAGGAYVYASRMARA